VRSRSAEDAGFVGQEHQHVGVEDVRHVARGDVGEGAREEIDRLGLGALGSNFGWRLCPNRKRAVYHRSVEDVSQPSHSGWHPYHVPLAL
jgi:hypothetical protein